MAAHVRWEDLPAAIRHRIEDSRKDEVRKAVAETAPGTKAWLCSSCGEVVKSLAACERHVRDVGHRRVECIDGAGQT